MKKLGLLGLLFAVATASFAQMPRTQGHVMALGLVDAGTLPAPLIGGLVYDVPSGAVLYSDGGTWTALTSGSSGPTGANAIRFNANNDRIQSTAPPGNASLYSVVMFVRLEVDRNDWSTTYAIENAGLSSDNIYETDNDGVTLTMFAAAFGGGYVGAGALTVGTWYCAAATVDVAATTTTVYLGAVGATPTKTTDGSHAYAVSSPTTFSLAANRAYGEFLNGDLAGVKVWSGVALTQTEVNTECTQLQPVKTANLWAFYALDDTSTMLDDSSGNGRNMTNPSGSGSWTVVAGPFP